MRRTLREYGQLGVLFVGFLAGVGLVVTCGGGGGGGQTVPSSTASTISFVPLNLGDLGFLVGDDEELDDIDVPPVLRGVTNVADALNRINVIMSPKLSIISEDPANDGLLPPIIIPPPAPGETPTPLTFSRALNGLVRAGNLSGPLRADRAVSVACNDSNVSDDLNPRIARIFCRDDGTEDNGVFEIIKASTPNDFPALVPLNNMNLVNDRVRVRIDGADASIETFDCNPLDPTPTISIVGDDGTIFAESSITSGGALVAGGAVNAGGAVTAGASITAGTSLFANLTARVGPALGPNVLLDAADGSVRATGPVEADTVQASSAMAVGPILAPTIVLTGATGGILADALTAVTSISTAMLTTNTATVNGDANVGGDVNTVGDVNGADLNATGTVNAPTVAATSVNAGTVNANDVNTTNFTSTGAANVSSLTATTTIAAGGDVSGASLSTSGLLSADSASVTNGLSAGTISSGAITSSAAVSAASFSSSGDVDAAGTVEGAMVNGTSTVTAGPSGAPVVTLDGATGGVSAVDVNASNDVTAAGTVNAADVTATGTVSGGTLTSLGTVNAVDVVAGNAVSAVDVNTTNLTATMAVSGDTLTAATTVTAADASVSGTVTAGTLTSTGAVNAVDVLASGNVSAVDVNASGNVTATGALNGATAAVAGALSAGSVASDTFDAGSGGVVIDGAAQTVSTGAIVLDGSTGGVTATSATVGGIGTSVDIASGDVTADGDLVAAANGRVAVENGSGAELASLSGTTHGELDLFAATGEALVFAGRDPASGATEAGVVEVYDANAVLTPAVRLEGSSGDIDATGTITAGVDLASMGTKTFIQPHPTDPSKEIRFVCLEGPESGIYARGEAQLVEGRVTVELPESFTLVAEEEGLTVQVTVLGECNGVYVPKSSISPAGFEIRELMNGRSRVEVSWTVFGVRRGFADHQPIQPNTHFVPKVAGERFFGVSNRTEALMIEAGILKADGTPDTGTAQRMGWPLRAAGDAGRR